MEYRPWDERTLANRYAVQPLRKPCVDVERQRVMRKGGDSVLIKNADGNTAKVKIRKGAENYDVVEVLDGLSDSSQLVVKK